MPIFMAIFVVLWSYLLTTQLRCLQKITLGTLRSRAQLLWGKGLLKCQCQMINNAVANTGCLATRHFNWDAFELKISLQQVDLSSQQILMAKKGIHKYTAQAISEYIMYIKIRGFGNWIPESARDPLLTKKNDKIDTFMLSLNSMSLN